MVPVGGRTFDQALAATFIEARSAGTDGSGAQGRTRWTGFPRMLTCQVVRSVLNELVLPPMV